MTADVIAGRFALCDPIGSGGSGTVWRAFDGKRQRYCAAKLLRQRDAGDLLRFVREQSVRLDHPHIVSPYSWVAEDGTVLIASDLITGGSLHTLIGDYGPLAESTVATVLRQVLAGLQAVHDAELIHRDVKPANLMLQATGTGQLHVVLTDFGLTISRLDARLTQVGMVIGTPGYVPPEVLMGGVPPDPRHDLYAAGRLALTLIAGEEPGGHLAQVIGSIQDPTLRSTIEALLRHDPDDRPVDANAAFDLLADLPTEPGPRTRDGERIDVLDQLPELPPGWGPGGPPDPASPAPDRVPPRATIVDVAPTAPALLADHPPALLAGQPPAGMAGQPPARIAGLPPAQETITGQPAAPTGQQLDRPVSNRAPDDVLPAQPAQPAPRGQLTARRRGPLLIAVAVAVLLVSGLILVVRLLSDASTGDPSPPTTSTVTTPGSAGTTAGSFGTTPATTTPGTSPPATATNAPTATATLTPENLRAGDPCTWQQEGDRRTGVDGDALACTLADGSYQWRSPG